MNEGIAAVLCEAGGHLNMEKVQIDEPQDKEVLIRMVGTGICHTDITLMNFGVYLPGIYGHEGSGIVEKVGPNVKKVKPGDHVVMCMIVPCGTCASCLQGKPMYCQTFNSFGALTRIDGTHTVTSGDEGIVHGHACSFASYMISTEAAVIKVPEDVPLELLGPFACGVQTGAGAVINSLKVPLGSSIAVFGLGTVGMSAVMAAKICGCKTIIGIDVVTERLELAKELGATHTINPKEEDALAKILEISAGGVDFSVDTVGNAQVTRQAVECTNAHTGVAGLIGAQSLDMEVTFSLISIITGRSIKGICEGDSIPDLFIPLLIDLYKAGKLPVDRLITYYKFEEIDKAIHDMEKGFTIKPVLKF